MKFCKYCGRELNEKERCSCPDSAATNKKLLLTTIGVGVITLIVIAIILIAIKGVAPTDNSTPETSSDTLQGTNAVMSDPFVTDSPSIPTDTDSDTETEQSVSDETGDLSEIMIGETTAPADETTESPAETTFEPTPETTIQETEPVPNDPDVPTILVDPFEFFVADLSFDGHDGTGTASVITNDNELIEKLIGEEPSSDNEEAFGQWFAQYVIYETHVKNISVKISAESNLSNGDEITVTVTVPEFLTDKIKNASKTYVVTNLPELQKVDILSMLEITFRGVSGEASARVEYSAEHDYLSRLNYSVSPSSFDLSNGDAVTITLSDAYIQYLAEEYNIVPTERVRMEIVSGLSEYVMIPDQLPAAQLMNIADRYLAEVEEKYDGYGMFTAESFNSEGIYWMTQKEESFIYGKAKTQLVFVVSYVEYLHGEYFETQYPCLVFKNLLIDPAGNIEIYYENGMSTFYTIEQFEVDYYVSKIG